MSKPDQTHSPGPLAPAGTTNMSNAPRRGFAPMTSDGLASTLLPGKASFKAATRARDLDLYVDQDTQVST